MRKGKLSRMTGIDLKFFIFCPITMALPFDIWLIKKFCKRVKFSKMYMNDPRVVKFLLASKWINNQKLQMN